MKKEETIIYYRPELAKHLRKTAEMAAELYEIDPRVILYNNLADAYDRKFNDTEKAEVLREITKWFSDKTSWYRDITPLSEKVNEVFQPRNTAPNSEMDVANHEICTGLHPENLTKAIAARYLCKFYQNIILAEKEKIDMTGFTKAEKHNVDSFFNMLLAPTKNPNIQIQEGCKKCYYDEHPYGSIISFEQSIKDTVEYIKKELDIRLYFFETPDEELDEPQK